MQYLIWKVLLIVKTYLVGKSVAVLLHNQKLVWKVPILLHTEQIVCRLLQRTVLLLLSKEVYNEEKLDFITCFTSVGFISSLIYLIFMVVVWIFFWKEDVLKRYSRPLQKSTYNLLSMK